MKRVLLFLLILAVQSTHVFAGQKNWNNPAGGNWYVDSNWTPYGIPTASDTVYIDLTGTYTVVYNQNIPSIKAVYLGASSGTQTLSNPGNVNGVTDTLFILANGVFQMTGGSYTATRVINYGTIRLFSNFGPSIENHDSLLIGGTNVTLSGNLVNQGNVYVSNTGTFSLAGGSSSASGNFFVSSGASTAFNTGTHILDASSSISGAGNVTFSSTTTTLSGSYNITGTTVNSAGTTTFNGAPGTLISIADSLHMSGGTLNLITGDSIIVPKVRMNSSTTVLLVNAPIRFTKSFTHNAGTLRGNGGSGVILVSPGLVYDIPTTSTTKWQKLTVLNEGTIQWSGSFSITLDSGVVINNYGLFNPQSTGVVTLNHNSGTMSQFNNYGTYRRSIGTTVSNINALFNGYSGSVVDVQIGTLAFNQNSVFTDADASVSSGALLQINDTSSWDAASSISGAGNVEFSSTVTMSGSYNLGGYTSATGGTTTFDGTPGSLVSIGDSLYMGAGTLRLFTGDSVIVASVRMNSLSGVLSFNAPLRFTRTFTHNAGTLNGLDPSVSVIVSPGLTYNASTTSTTRWRRLTLLNHGTVQWTGSFSITLDSGVVINNYGLFNPQSTGTVTLNYGVGAMAQFNNYGTYRRSVGSTVSNINTLFNGFTGSLVEIQSGTLAFNQNSLFTDADATVSSGALLQINDTSSWDAASSISGSGNVQFDASSTVSGGYTITGTTSNTAGSTTFNNGAGLLGLLDSVYVSSGTLIFSSADTVRINRLQLSGGTLTGLAPVWINTAWNWIWGTVSGTDSTVVTVISPGAVLNVSSGSTKTQSRRTVVNYGTMIHTGTSFTYTNGAVFDNQPSGVIDLAGSNSGFSYSAGTSKPRIKNSGLLKKSAGTASTIAIVVENTNGRIEVQATSLTISDTTKWFNSVDTVFAGATMIFSGGTATKHTFDSGSRLAGSGNVTFSNGTVSLSGTYDILGVSTFTGDTVKLNGAGGSIQSLGDSVSVTGGTVTITAPDNIQLRTLRQSAGTFNVSTGDSIIVTTLNLTSGTLSGNSPMRIVNQFNWSGGTMSATDSTITTVIQSQALFSVNNRALRKRTLINQGTITWSTGHWENYDGAIVQNNPGALIDAQNDYWFYHNGGTVSKFVNNGTFRKSAGTGTSTLQIQASHLNGQIQIQSGIVTFNQTGTYANTDFTITNHAILQFNGGTQQLDANSDITGTGAVRVYNGKYFIGGVYNVSDSTLFGGNDTTFFTGGTNFLQNVGTKLRIDNGIVNFSNGDSVIVPTYWQLGGTLTGNSPMRVTSECRWESGTIMATDSLVTMEIPAYASLNMNGGLLYLAKRTFNIYANMNWNSGWFRVYNGAIINNYGTWDHRVNNNIEWIGGSLPYFNNYATYIKSTSATNNFIDIGFNTTNSIVQIKKGTLNINNMSNSVNSRFIIDSAATLQWDGFGRTHTVDSLSSISGPGNMAFYSGTTNMKDTVDITGETLILGGTANFMGPLGTLKSLGKKLTLGNASAYFYGDSLKIDSLVTSGTLGGTAPIYVNSKFVLNGGTVVSTDSATTITIPVGATFYWSGNGTFQRRTFNNYGTAIWTSPWGLDNNAVYNNMAGALTDWAVDGNTNWFGGSSNNFNNYGTLRKSGGTGISSFEYYVNNYGLIEVQSGTLYFGASGTHAGGDFVLSPGSTIDFAAGNHTFDASSSVTGTGTVLISPTLFAMDGIYNITGSTTIGGGTINFDSTFSTTVRTTINGGTTNFRGIPDQFLGAGNKMSVGNAAVNFITTDSLKIDTLLVTGALANIGGNNNWLVRHLLQFSAGTISSSDPSLSVMLPIGSTFLWNGNGSFDRRGIINYGTADWSAPWGFSNSSIYYNMPDATTNLTSDYNSNWFFATSEPYLINYGTLRKSGGTGISSFEYQISNYGTLQIDSGLAILCYDSLVNFSTGIITGKGTLDVSTRFTNAGTIQPGTSPGNLRITGNLKNTSTAIYDAEIGGKNPGQFDELRASGSATLAGILNVNLINGYLPGLNDTVKVLNYGSKTGAFGEINGLRTGGQYDFVPLYKDTALFLIASDSLNMEPVASTDFLSAPEDVETHLPVLRNDVDSNSDALSIVEILPGYPQYGTAYIGSPDTTIVYTSQLNYFGKDTLRYIIYDGRGGWDTAGVSITVTPVNDAPSPKDTFAIADQFGIARINVTATATDVEGSALFASTASKPKYGEAHVDGNNSFIVYIPPVHFTGIDSFKFYVSDGGAVDSATMVVTVTAGDSFLVTRSNFNTSDEGWNTFNDVSDSAFLASGGNPGGFFYAVDAVTGAWWYFNAPSKFIGDLSSTYNKTLRFDMKQNPAGTDNSQPDVVLIGNGVQLNYDFPRNPRTNFTGFGLILNETTGWKKQTTGLAPSQAEMQNVLANVTALRIRGEFTGGADSAGIDNIILSKIPGNTSPVANADDASTNEEVSVQIYSLTNDTDPESQSLTINTVSNPIHGSALIDVGNLSITYVPDSNFAGIDSFAYHITDGYGGQDSAYIRVTVNNINDAPVVAAALPDTTFNEDFGQSFLAMMSDVFNDVDNGPTYSASNLSAGVTPFISNDSLYVLSSASFNGAVDIRVSANDGEFTAADTFAVTVSGVNNAPTLTLALPDTSFIEDFERTFTAFLSAYFTDVDGDSLTFTSNILSGSVTVYTDLDSLFITGGADFNGTAVIRVTASDGQNTVSDTFQVTVAPINDSPIRITEISDQNLTQDFGKVFGDRLSDIFTDIDNGSLTYGITTLNAGVNGEISNDTLYLVSTNGFTGASTLRVTANDGEYTVADTFIVNVNSSNVPPTLSTMLRDTTLSEDFGPLFVYKLSNFFSDAEVLTYSGSALGAGVAAQVSNDSMYLTSTADFNGSVSVLVTASDGIFTVPDTLIVTVSPVNDAPVLIQSFSDVNLNEDFGTYAAGLISANFSDVDNALNTSATNLDEGVTSVISNDSLYLLGSTNFSGNVRIKITNDDGQYTVSDTFVVTVTPQNDGPSVFSLIAPAQNALINILRPVFRWNASKDIDGDTLQYLLEISSQANFSSLAQSYSITDTVQTLTSDLDSTGTYFWRVTVSDGNGGSHQTSALTLQIDATKPDLRISILQGTVTKRYLDAYAFSNENLSGAVNSTFTLKNSSGTTIDSRSAAMSKIGTSNLYTSSYHLSNVGSLEVQVTAQDAAANQRIATRSYTVSALLKGEAFVSFTPEFEVSLHKPALSESGFLLTGSITEIESTVKPSLNAGVELTGTTELKDALKLTIRYDASEMVTLMLRSDFDERKIGIYRVTESGFEYVGGQGHGHAVTMTVSSYGKYVALYDDRHEIVPEKIELAQNYPNPFNPSTTIRYGLATSGKVRLVIYNVLGQRVRELINANQPAGYHKILWNGKNAAGQTVATGLYIYRLETPDGALSRKMMLIK